MKKRTINKDKIDLFSHNWKMLLACIIPLALILILPIIGVSKNLSIVGAIILKIKGMHCESCAKLIEDEMENEVKKIKVSFFDGRAEIEFDEKKISVDEIKNKITNLGYKVK